MSLDWTNRMDLEEPGDSMLKMGMGVRDITPHRAMALSGFAHRTESFHAIHSRLFLKAFVFEGDDSAERAAVIIADLIGWDSVIANAIEEKNEREFGIKVTLLSATHTHSGPCVLSRGHRILSARDESYMALLHQQVNDAIKEALGNLEVISIYAGTGPVSGLIINRRLPTPEGIMTKPNPDGPVDEEGTVWRFDREDGSTKAFWVHAACHPTILADDIVSADFPGEVTQRMEEEYSGTVCAYLQGCSGDLRANLSDDQGVFRKTFAEDVRAFGLCFFHDILAICQRPMRLLGGGRLIAAKQLAYGLVKFDHRPIPQTPTPDCHEMNGADTVIALRISALRLTTQAALLALPGEPSVFYQQFIKSYRKESILPLGYCNDLPGYLPTSPQIREGGYESLGSCPFFGLPGPFDCSLEEELCSKSTDLIDYIFSPSMLPLGSS